MSEGNPPVETVTASNLRPKHRDRPVISRKVRSLLSIRTPSHKANAQVVLRRVTK